MESVKCKECGYLSVRSADDSSVMSASESVRNDGKTRIRQTRMHSESIGAPIHVNTQDTLICFLGQPEFETDLKELDSPLETIAKARSCLEYRPWIPGKTPQEHEEMSLLEQVRVETAEFRRQEEERRQQWRDEDNQKHTEQLVEQKKSNRIAIAAAVIAAVAALLALVPGAVRWLNQ
mgnify:FL=1